MKKLLSLLGSALALVLVVFLVHGAYAQVTDDPSAKLDQAVALLRSGQPQAARAVIATIAPSDPDSTAALGYDALCLYSLDKLKFLNLMQTPAMQAAAFSDALREELDFDQIEAQFSYRQFEQLRPRLANFITQHTNSPRLRPVLEYQLAAWYERGMKKILEACGSRDPQVFQQRYPDGRSNLVEFLQLAVTLNETNYQFLPKRSLTQEIWKAQIALGETPQAPAAASATEREAEAFMSLRLLERLQPQAVDDNLRRMTNFLNDFPASPHAKRVRFDLSAASFPRAETLYRAALHSSDTNAAARDRRQARPYLQFTENLTNELYADPAAGITASDVCDRLDDLLYGYYFENDYARILTVTAALLTNSPPDAPVWLMAKTYRGIIFQKESPPDWKAAAAELDAAIAFGFHGNASQDHWVLRATSWRITVARQNNDLPKATALIQWVRDSNCTKDQRVHFVKAWAFLLKSDSTSH